jgi:hypothetical protein
MELRTFQCSTSYPDVSVYFSLHIGPFEWYRRYEYLKQRKEEQKIPSVWMPRLTEVGDGGWTYAVLKFYGTAKTLCKEAGLVQFHEWNYFERQFELMLALRDYCDQYRGGNYEAFPQCSQLRLAGQDRLVRLIAICGGSIVVASRLGLTCDARNSLYEFDLNWGAFDLEFGIALMGFVRNEQMRRIPPLQPADIFMPTETELRESDIDGLGEALHEKIIQYGGYENVARRLGLGWRPSR